MPRVNVWLPEDLYETFRGQLPDLNLSKALQEAIRGRLRCLHDTLVCRACSVEVDHVGLISEWLHKFYIDYLGRLEPLVAVAGTAEGAARILRDLADSWHAAGVMGRDYRRHPLPRPSKAAREQATPGRSERAMPPMGIKDWSQHPAVRKRAADQRNQARVAARRRREESA